MQDARERESWKRSTCSNFLKRKNTLGVFWGMGGSKYENWELHVWRPLQGSVGTKWLRCSDCGTEACSILQCFEGMLSKHVRDCVRSDLSTRVSAVTGFCLRIFLRKRLQQATKVCAGLCQKLNSFLSQRSKSCLCKDFLGERLSVKVFLSIRCLCKRAACALPKPLS